MLTDPQIVPFLMELEHVAEAAVTHFEQLEVAASSWLALRPQSGPTVAHRAATFQEAAFDALELFLATWARASLLVYPVGKSPFTMQRGATMREKLHVDRTMLEQRELRDSWAHIDERLDEAVGRGDQVQLRRFLLSSEVTDAALNNSPRVLVMDTLVVYFQSRHGGTGSTDLRALSSALKSAALGAHRVLNARQ